MAEPALTTSFLSLHNIGKSYAVPVLKGVTFDLFPGEVLALAGENGAGKSTLSRIISGLTSATTGKMLLDGKPYQPINRVAAEEAGIRIVLQELSLISNLTVAENLFLNHLPSKFGLLDKKKLLQDARTIMQQVGLESIDPDMQVGDLGIGQQQMVEIAKGLIGTCRLLILDEPTAMLSTHETELLFIQIERLRKQGVCVVYISHRLEEIKRMADRIAILRDGELIQVQSVKNLTIDDIVHSMVGRRIENALDFGERAIGGTHLEVKHLSRGTVPNNVSFTLRQGEILGIAGLVGSGRTELLRLIFGVDQPDQGEMLLNNVPYRPSSPRQAVKSGIAMITEDRKEQGLLLPQSISTNITLANLTYISKMGWINKNDEKVKSVHYIDELGIRCQSEEQAVSELSGGNQQKVVLARWLLRDCSLLLLDEPTRGIDIGARFEIYSLLTSLCQMGKSMIIISSDIRELMLLCDRICVMSVGRLVETFERGKLPQGSQLQENQPWDQDMMLAAAFSGHL